MNVDGAAFGMGRSIGASGGVRIRFSRFRGALKGDPGVVRPATDQEKLNISVCLKNRLSIWT